MWRMVTGLAFTSVPFSITCLPAYEGSQVAIGSSSRKRPSSQSIISAVDTIGLVMDMSEKIVSFCIGAPSSFERNPCASKWTTLPRRATSVVAPAISPRSM